MEPTNTQGSTYEEERFNIPTNPQNTTNTSPAGYQRPSSLRPNTPRQMVEDDDMDDDDEEIEDEESYGEESFIDKIKANPMIGMGIVVGIILIIVLVVLLIPKGEENSESGSSNEEVVEESDENLLSEEELMAQMVAEQEAVNNQEVEETPAEEPEAFTYTRSERAGLAAWGYSASEIDELEQNETDYEEAIADIRSEFLKNAAETYKALLMNSYDSPNEQYRYVLSNSIFGLPIPNVDTSNTYTSNYGDKLNVDFRKIPLQGYQPMIKVTFPNDEVVLFVNITYNQYIGLPEQGNCVIHYDCSERDGVKTYSNVTLVE